jgi:hypothetical protein
MQRANLKASCCSRWIWAWLCLPPELVALGELGEFEPQAAIAAAAAIATTAAGRLEADLVMT